MVTQKQQMAASDFNLEKINTGDLSKHIGATLQVEGNIAVFGRRGTGKTEISKQQIKQADMQEVYINLSVMERVDLGGYPNVMGTYNNEKERKFVNFLLPQFYQPMVEGKKKVVALLDEVDKADQSLWAPLLEFTQFRSINGIQLPNLKAIIMTGNLISEGGSRPSLPLLDRAEKYLVEADVISWMNWAAKTGRIHPSITAYINDNPADLFGAVDPGERYGDPSPRGWARSSDLLRKGEALGWDTELLNKKVCGCIGKEAGMKYSLYYMHYQHLLPMIDKIYEGKDIRKEYLDLDPSKQLIACMITCARLSSHLDQVKGNKVPAALKHVGRFLNYVSHENVLASVRSQVTIHRIIDYNLDEDNSDWQEILSRINKTVDE